MTEATLTKPKGWSTSLWTGEKHDKLVSVVIKPVDGADAKKGPWSLSITPSRSVRKTFEQEYATRSAVCDKLAELGCRLHEIQSWIEYLHGERYP